MHNNIFDTNDITLNRLKLKPLVIFEKVLELHSIAYAAVELNLSQSAVTKAIQELESHLNIVLFERMNRGVVPTVEAELLGVRVKSLLAELRYLVDDINQFNSAHSGHVVVGTVISASDELLPKTIYKIKQQEPNILISLQIGTIRQLFPALLRGELDMVIGRIPDMNSPFHQLYSLEHIPLYPEDLVFVVSENHPLLGKTDFGLVDLVGYPWILPPPDSPMRSMLRKYFNVNNLPEPSNVVESLSILTNINLVSMGEFITCMSSYIAQNILINRKLSVLPLDGITESVNVGISVRKNDRLTPASEKFIACLKSVVLGGSYATNRD